VEKEPAFLERGCSTTQATSSLAGYNRFATKTKGETYNPSSLPSDSAIYTEAAASPTQTSLTKGKTCPAEDKT